MRFRASVLVTLIATAFLSSAPHVLAAERIHVSNNWSGYEVLGGKYTGVSGTWVVPEATTTSKGTSAHTVWVGIGGAQTHDLIQAGTQAVVTKGKVVYYVWYELLPEPQRSLPVAVQPGDTVTVTIQELSKDQWRIIFFNQTTSTTFVKDVTYVSSYSSAEWIVEKPSASVNGKNRYIELNDFDTVTFTDAKAVEDGVEKELPTMTMEKILMIGKSKRSIASAPSTATSSTFTVTHYSDKAGRDYLRTFRKSYRMVKTKNEKNELQTTSSSSPTDPTIIRIEL